MNEATYNYVRQHADDDVRLLALRGCKDPDVDLPFALQQIQGRQTARRKLPSWAAIDGIQYPVHLSMEQCSSEQTARYKATLCLSPSIPEQSSPIPADAPTRGLSLHPSPSTLLDLTGGFGVDFAFMSEAFDEATYVERDPDLFAISSANLALLCPKARTICADGMEVLRQIDHVTLIYLDPARRDNQGSRTYGIADCTPNVLDIKDEILDKADFVMLKLSPMLDWRKAVQDLGSEYVSEVHIVSVDNECKELLLLLTKAPSAPLTIHCVNNDQHFSYYPSAQGDASLAKNPPPSTHQPSPTESPSLWRGSGEAFLLEPNASIMKAGCFAELADHFGITPIAPNSHLFLSDSPIPDFPGRIFQIMAVSSMNKHDLKSALQGITRANITTRNFPLSAVQLRQRLKLLDGGDTYIFATTQADGTRILLVCRR